MLHINFKVILVYFQSLQSYKTGGKLQVQIHLAILCNDITVKKLIFTLNSKHYFELIIKLTWPKRFLFCLLYPFFFNRARMAFCCFFVTNNFQVQTGGVPVVQLTVQEKLTFKRSEFNCPVTPTVKRITINIRSQRIKPIIVQYFHITECLSLECAISCSHNVSGLTR